jgi:hypothetical protein
MGRMKGLFVAWAIVAIGGCGKVTKRQPSGPANGGKGGSPGDPPEGGGAPSAAGAPSCDGVVCSTLECESRAEVDPLTELVTVGAACCPVCRVKPSCVGQTCEYMVGAMGMVEFPPLIDCPQGHRAGIIPGACCYGCVPDDPPPEPPDCSVPCGDGSPLMCASGYVPSKLAGECCDRCVPDPSYCVADHDCMLAERVSEPCACTRAISVRLYEADPCWVSSASPREVPAWCMPRDCASCAEAPRPTVAMCVDHRCTGG